MTVAGVAALYTVYLVVNGQEPVKMVENTTLPSPITDSSFKQTATEVTVPDTRPTQLGGDAANTGTLTEDANTRALNLQRIEHDNRICRFRLPNDQEVSPTTQRKTWNIGGRNEYLTAATDLNSYHEIQSDAERFEFWEDLGMNPEYASQLTGNHCVQDSHYQVGQTINP